MNANIKTKWLAALRSGEYKKTKGNLQDPGGFCCLGVLCDLHRKETGGEWDTRGYTCEYLGSADVLPVAVMEWAGLADTYGGDVYWEATQEEDDTGYMMDALPEVNDAYGTTFAMIADLIEAQIQGDV